MEGEKENTSPQPQSPLSPRADLPSRKPGAPSGNKNASRLNPKVREALAIYLDEDEITVEQACERVGIHPATYYRAQHSEAFARYFSEQGRKRVNSRIAVEALKGWGKLVKHAKSEYTRDSVYTRTLQAAGVLPTVDARQQPAATGGVTIRFVSTAAQNGATAVQVDVHPTKEDANSDG